MRNFRHRLPVVINIVPGRWVKRKTIGCIEGNGIGMGNRMGKGKEGKGKEGMGKEGKGNGMAEGVSRGFSVMRKCIMYYGNTLVRPILVLGRRQYPHVFYVVFVFVFVFVNVVVVFVFYYCHPLLVLLRPVVVLPKHMHLR
jgi:hypothetical protein